MRNLLFILISIFTWQSQAQIPYHVDTSFKVDMDGYLPCEGNFSDYVFDDDGKIVVVGSFSSDFSNTKPFHIVRFNRNGTIDHNFAYHSPYTYSGTPTDGITRITKHNGFYYLGYSGQVGVARLFPDGTIDTTFRFHFADYKSEDFSVGGITVNPDGKVVISGEFERKSGVHERVIRINTDGSKDSTFYSTIDYYDAGPNYRLPDGNFLIGSWESDPTVIRSGLWRIFPDGQLDTSFNTGCTWGIANRILALPDNKIICTGLFKLPGIYDTVEFCRFLPNGSIDTTFHYYDYHFPIDIFGFIQNKIIVSGSFNNWNPFYLYKYNRIAILDTLGNIDTNLISHDFGPDSTHSISRYRSIGFIRYNNGKIYLGGGYFDSFGGFQTVNLVRLYDESVGINEVPSQINDVLIIQPNPSSNNVNITLPEHLAFSNEGKLEIWNLLSQKVGSIPLKNNQKSVPIDITSWKEGLYLIRVISSTRQLQIGKLLIAR